MPTRCPLSQDHPEDDAAFLLFLRLRVVSPASLRCSPHVQASRGRPWPLNGRTVSHVSRNFFPLCPRPCACTRILRKTRELRRGRLQSLSAHASCWNAPAAASIAPTARLFPIRNPEAVGTAPISTSANLRTQSAPFPKPHYSGATPSSVRNRGKLLYGIRTPPAGSLDHARSAADHACGVPTAVAVPLPTVAVDLAKFPLLCWRRG